MKQKLLGTAVLLALPAALLAASPNGLVLHVAPAGNDTHPGTPGQPLATLAAAQRAARLAARHGPVTVLLHEGTYCLEAPVRFTPEDSGRPEAPVVYAAAPGERPVLSGGMPLKLRWQPLSNGIVQAQTPPGLTVDQLFVNGLRQPMARYPNFDPQVRHFNGYAADAIAPNRTARWRDPAGGFIHAMHNALWGDMHWRILGRKADGSLDYEGGWQNNRPSSMHREFRFVENIREELDAPGEWYHDARAGLLLFLPPAGVDVNTATFEAVRLRHVIECAGSQEKPVRFLTLRGLTFRRTARTFMDNREPLLRSDWTVYRGGAVVIEGAEDVVLEECEFDQVGGNAVFVHRYNRRVAVKSCLIRESGANGVAFVGDPSAVRSPLFNYSQKFDYAALDRVPGPRSDAYPADCLVEDCLITRSGRFEKQTAPVQIAMARNITVRHCSIYDVPRAGINIGDGCWGGHVIEHCDVFDTVLETGDHGSFNSWGRDRYWHPDVRLVDRQVAADPGLPFLDAMSPVVLRYNRWRCDHGWDVDLDDGSSNYQIHHNLLLRGGLKLREGYRRLVTNNIIVGNSLHPHVWFENSGDVFTGNIVMGPYRPALMNIARWGQEVDRNLFTTSEADRTRFAAQGCDAHSLVGDPLFVDAAAGDYRVREGSPALRLGFVNFDMTAFGVRPARLRALARTPVIPRAPKTPGQAASPARPEISWLGATLRDLVHEEYSALGIAADAGGVLLVTVPRQSAAFRAGLRGGDFLHTVNGQTFRDAQDFLRLLRAQPPGQALRLDLIRHQQSATIVVGGDLPATPPAGRPAR